LGEFSCGRYHQGYDAMTHGGVVAAIIDAAMVQCLMGHGIVGYTTDLSIRYRKPVMILQPTLVEAWIAGIRVGCLYSMKCEVFQNGKVAVRATATFYKTKSNNMRT
jgi:acyl-coenzyme A thioesterase PaaI-like protein